MATRTITQYVDDLTGEELAEGKGETVSFGLDGKHYEIDLSDKNAKELRKVLDRYVGVAHRVGTKTGRRGKRTSVTNTGEIREWARQNGFNVPDRGRLPKEVMEAWDAR